MIDIVRDACFLGQPAGLSVNLGDLIVVAPFHLGSGQGQDTALDRVPVFPNPRLALSLVRRDPLVVLPLQHFPNAILAEPAAKSGKRDKIRRLFEFERRQIAFALLALEKLTAPPPATRVLYLDQSIRQTPRNLELR